MSDTPFFQIAGHQLPPIVASSPIQQRRLPPLSALADPYPFIGPKLPPVRATNKPITGRPPSRSHASNRRLTPSSPLIQSVDVGESPRSSFGERTSFERLEVVGPNGHWDDNQIPTKSVHLGRTTLKGILDPGVLSPPMSPPSPELTSPPSEPLAWTPSATTTSPLAFETPIVTSSPSRTLQEFIETMMVLDLKDRETWDKARQDLLGLYGISADPVELKLESLQLRRQDLLAEWEVDCGTFLDDRSMATYSRRCQINDIDYELKFLQVLRQRNQNS